MRESEVRYLVGLGIASAMSLVLLLSDAVIYHVFTHPYLAWNLFLAWIPLGFAYWLDWLLHRYLWSSWEALSLSIAWLVFLPNSFYIVSDFVHLSDLSANQLVFGVIVTMAFALTGLWLGVTSLHLVERQLAKRIGEGWAGLCSAMVLLSASFAIYVGRDLRWNSWDVLTSPFGLLFDLSERLLHPAQYGQVLSVALPFFALISSVYFLATAMVVRRASSVDKQNS